MLRREPKNVFFIVAVGSHFKLGISFGSILSFDCPPRDWQTGSFDMTLLAGSTYLTSEVCTILTLPFESTIST